MSPLLKMHIRLRYTVIVNPSIWFIYLLCVLDLLSIPEEEKKKKNYKEKNGKKQYKN